METFKLSELIQQLRYYGQLRFAILTLFLAITGGLLAAFYRPEDVLSKLALVLAGWLFCLVCGYFQWKLGAIHGRCLDHLKKLAGAKLEGGEEFISMLFGEGLTDPASRRLDRVKGSLLRKYVRKKEQDRYAFLGPVTLSVLALHVLIALTWLVLLVVQLNQLGCG